MNDYQIFISYRRDGGEFLAGRVSDKLTELGYAVFYDIESMRSGKFDEQIYAAIDVCEDVLLVLPPKGLDRCKDEEDWVRKEIEYSLKTGKNIIPLLMPGFSFPADMPKSIEPVSRQEGVLVDSHYFDAVIKRIESLLESKATKKQTEMNETLKDGIRFLSMKMYPQAENCFDKVIRESVSDPDAYFYAAVAKLAGKRPFLVPRPAIAEAEQFLDAALMYGEIGLYYYLYAYIKSDFYEKKMLRTAPSSRELLAKARALGMTADRADELFQLLHTQKPEGF